MARPKGSTNKNTIEKRKLLEESQAKRRAALEAAGIEVEETDDPLVNLLAISIDKSYPFDVRMKAMVEALPYVHARKTENVNINNTRYVVALPDGEISMEEWKRRVQPTEEETAH